jgi:hypothetical protein
VKKYGRAEQAAVDNMIQCLCLARWKTKATDTGSEYVILIAFPLHYWLQEHTTVLHLVIFLSVSFNTLPVANIV